MADQTRDSWTYRAIDAESQLLALEFARERISELYREQRAELDALKASYALIEKQLHSWRTWAQFVFFGGGAVSGDDRELQRKVCERADKYEKRPENGTSSPSGKP